SIGTKNQCRAIAEVFDVEREGFCDIWRVGDDDRVGARLGGLCYLGPQPAAPCSGRISTHALSGVAKLRKGLHRPKSGEAFGLERPIGWAAEHAADGNPQPPEYGPHRARRGSALFIELALVFHITELRVSGIRWRHGRAGVPHENDVAASLQRPRQVPSGEWRSQRGTAEREL